METKQISLVIPSTLLEASREYSEEYGYRTIQEFIVDLLRKKIIIENNERYKEIEERMKKGVGVKKFSSQKEAIKYLRSL
jgi:metal-responsive CopG/Arc/MetJ family transcriptional regulator